MMGIDGHCCCNNLTPVVTWQWKLAIVLTLVDLTFKSNNNNVIKNHVI